MNNDERIKQIDDLINAEKEKGCKACRSLGIWHCAYPDECGNWDEVIKLELEKKQLNAHTLK